MNILAAFFSKKTINTYLNLEIRVACREFLAFKYVVIVFFETKQMIIYNCPSDILKTRVFRYTIFICICVGSQRILNVYFVVEK